ncbi:Rieske (2Fe-2S) protein [Kordiimonas pumila]|uniref:Rieske 2Fe-2S domain-containing protein n=1 Tax=Kordiimonas pumila TaxID=2161677 RepID=A0ABV7D9E2_9PROT|nr:Rieske (2Fe-2S) protein [Kordiimonas pumila]
MSVETQHQFSNRTSGPEIIKRALGKPVPFEGENGTFTQSWFPICLSSAATPDFVRGFDFLDGRVIVFRDKDGQAHVMSAYCPHLGADLSIGDMVDGNVRCVFHHWKYGADGRCSGMPSKDPIPTNARLFKFPVCEKYGTIWAYNGLEPHYELPDFPYPDEDLVFKTRIFGNEIPTDPWILCANTPDMQHIRYLHGININGDNPHDIVEWTDHSMFYEFEGTHVTGDPVKHRLGIVGTSMYYQSTEFAGKWFGFVSPFTLNRPGRSTAFITVCARKDMGTPEEVDQYLEEIVELEKRVVIDDLMNMQTIHLKPGTLTRSDLTLSRFFDYLRAFPRAHPSADFIR